MENLLLISVSECYSDVGIIYHTGNLPSETDTYVYVNVTSTMPPSAKMSKPCDQLCVLKMQCKAPFGPYNNESDGNSCQRCNKFPPPTASKPKYAMHE